MSKVFVALNDRNGMLQIFEARDYQQKAYDEFNKKIIKENPVEFKFDGDINFTIQKFDSKGLNGIYPSFYTMVTERNDRYILSNNEEELKNFVAFRNRMMMSGGKKTSKKSSKKNNKKSSKKNDKKSSKKSSKKNDKKSSKKSSKSNRK